MLDDEAIGEAVIEAITRGSLVRVSLAVDRATPPTEIEDPDVVFVWSASANAQIGQTVIDLVAKNGKAGAPRDEQ